MGDGMTAPRPDQGDGRVAPEPAVETFIDSFPCALYGYVRWPDGRNRFVHISAQCEEIFGYSPDAVMRDPRLLWRAVHPDDLDRLEREDQVANSRLQPFQAEVRIRTTAGELKWIQLSSMPSSQLYQGQVLWSGVILDITERKRAEDEKTQLVEELQEALSRIRRLEGIIPICSYCKKIRDDAGAWQHIDVYLRQHSDTDFSHGICPDCQDTHFPDD